MIPVLRGNPAALKQSMESRHWTFREREDRTPAGPGYFGMLYTEDEDLYATELPTTCFYDGPGANGLIPVIVPTLTREELVHLVEGGRPTMGIIEKAKHHADQRQREGKSPFAESGEQRPLPSP